MRVSCPRNSYRFGSSTSGQRPAGAGSRRDNIYRLGTQSAFPVDCGVLSVLQRSDRTFRSNDLTGMMRQNQDPCQTRYFAQRLLLHCIDKCNCFSIYLYLISTDMLCNPTSFTSNNFTLTNIVK